MENLKLEFVSENSDIRLSDEILNHVSNKYYRRMKFKEATILLNGKPCETWKEVKKGDLITIFIKDEKENNWPLYGCETEILFENDNYLVVNKRAGLLSIPTKGEPKSLYQEICFYLKEKNEPATVSIINRLDKETKGLCLIAKNRYVAYQMNPVHEKMVRKYLCVCEGVFEKASGRIENYIEKSSDSNKRFISDEKTGKIAISNYKVIKQFEKYALVEFVLETGRTHQIRLHCASMNHPIIGDSLYGKTENPNMLLCSYYVKFHDENENKDIEISIESGWEDGRI